MMQRKLLMDIAMALRAYRTEHGTYPPNLAELVPRYINEVPRDHLGQEALHYEPVPKGYLLYSIGPNGHGERERTDEPVS